MLSVEVIRGAQVFLIEIHLVPQPILVGLFLHLCLESCNWKCQRSEMAVVKRGGLGVLGFSSLMGIAGTILLA